MRIQPLFVALCVACLAPADTLTLRDGTTVEGVFVGGDSRQIRLAVGDKVETFAIGDVSTLRFGAAPAAQAPSRPAPAQAPAPAPAPPAARSAAGEVPAGTPITIRMIDDIDSQRDSLGKTFRASLDESIVVNDTTVVARGADVLVRLVEDRQSGRLTGRTELTLDIVSMTVNGRELELATSEVTQASESRTTETAKRSGGLAAAGAVIGAIAGGGTGAAIGAATGAGIGAGVQVATKGATVKIPSETRLTFTLEKPFRP